MTKAFEWNDRFRILRGEEYFTVTKELQFPDHHLPEVRVPGKLHCLGPSVAVAAMVGSYSNKSLAGALTRLTGRREPDTPGLCQQLFKNQEKSWRWVRSVARAYATEVQASDASGRQQYSILELEALHYDDPHVKRALRVLAYFKMEREGRLFDPRTSQSGVEGKLKMEIAKPGKYCRLTVDLKVPASLIGAWITKGWKQDLASTPYQTSTLCAWFCPDASDAQLEATFESLIHPTHPVMFAYFSDDSALSILTPTGVEYYDMDISACDKSHGKTVFKVLRALVPQRQHVELDLLLSQLKERITIRDVTERSRKVVLKPREHILYSGSTLTTIVNNVANLMIAWSIDREGARTAPAIIEAAAKVGYIVTLKRHTRFEQLQFLKHSPVELPNGKIVAMVNAGVLLRAVGQSRRREHHMTVEEQSAMMAAGLVSSLYPTYRPQMLERFRQRMLLESGGRELDHSDSWLATTKTKGDVVIVETDRFLRRYDLSAVDAHGFTALCESASAGHIAVGSDLGHMLAIDYDLNTNDAVNGAYPAGDVQLERQLGR